MLRRKYILLILLLMSLPLASHSQELLTPLRYGRQYNDVKSLSSVRLPFFDDFSNYEGAPKASLWENGCALVNADYASIAPTIGVVTLDAVDCNGDLYQNTTEPFSADTLMSRPIRLDSIFDVQPHRLTVSDSVILSFYYAPAGVGPNAWSSVGCAPGPNDSLLLEFYNPSLNRWERIWSVANVDVDSLMTNVGNVWQICKIRILNQEYFDSIFRFRFRNICSLNNMTTQGLVGNSDQWNIDYVWLDYNRSILDSSIRDVAFVEKSPSFLKRYVAMPAKQYSTSDMADSVVLRVVNLYEQQLSTSYSYSVYDEEGSLLNNNAAGHENVPAWIVDSTWLRTSQYLASTVNFSFPETDRYKKYRIEHVVKEGVSGDVHPENDTIVIIQSLENYYAYDDGKAERGYGIKTNNGVIRIAYQFDLRVGDTLSALDIYFNKTMDSYNETIPFYVCVWSDNGGFPGSLIYKDEQRRYARFEGLNAYCRYQLERLVAIEGTVFIGIQQATAGYINMGFDCNNNASQYTFYQVGSGSSWQKSLQNGAIMMRPYWGANALLGITDAESQITLVYPNISSSLIQIDNNVDYVEIFNIKGVEMGKMRGGDIVDVSKWPKGLYIIKYKNLIEKLIVR